MTEHAANITVTDDDGVQNGPFIGFLGRRIPTGLGAVIVTIVALLVTVTWVWSLVVTWMGNSDDFLPLFQTTVAGLAVVGSAVYGYKTLSWIFPLIVSAFWIWVSVSPLDAPLQVILQAITVSALVFATVFSVTATHQSEQPRF